MARPLAIVFTALIIVLVACGRGDEPSVETPTPFPVTPAVPRITTAAPIPITLENLAANPDFFVGATLQLSGGFRRLPLQICAGETHRSPSTWGLEADGYLASAAGMDEQLRALLTEGQPITVEGQWLKFSGPIGCGADAPEQELWYLSVDRILEPNPLVSAPAQQDPGAPQPTLIAEVPPALTATTDFPTAVPFTPTVPPVIEPSPALLPTATFTSEAISATLTITATATLTATPPGTGTPGGRMTPTPFASNTPDETTPAASTPTATSTVAATPGNGSAENKGPLDFEDLLFASLAEGATHSWELDLAANEAITVTVAPAAQANIALSIVAPDGSRLVNSQNQAPVGEPETITDLVTGDPGIYRLLVTTSPAAATDYAIMVMDSGSYSFEFRGTLGTNFLRSDSLLANHDHFWFFSSTSGQSLSFTVTPQDAGDPYVELYDPGGSRILTIDSGEGGEAETLDGYTLLSSGMYGIRVAEFDFEPMTYQIVLSSP